jgi:transmembrane sensor
VKKKPVHELANALGWRNGLLIFDSTTLADAAQEFNRYNNTQLVIASSAAHLPVVGTFRANDVEAFARVSQQVFGVLVKKRGDQIVISR